MSERSPDEPPELAPEEAFLLLADETRVRILTELATAWVQDWPGGLGFSELRERVDVADSGRFNYHLDKLVGRFVDRREDRYKVNFDGLRVYRAIVAGTFTERPVVESFPTGEDCYDCGAELSARFGGDMFVVECPDCGAKAAEVALPPRGLEGRSSTERLRAAAWWGRSSRELLARGVCPWCSGPAAGTVRRLEETPVVDEDVLEFVIEWRCSECGGGLWTTLGQYLMTRTAVVALFHEHGIDLAERPYWTLEWAVTDRHTTLHEDPLEYVIDLPVGDGHRAVLDADLELVELE